MSDLFSTFAERLSAAWAALGAEVERILPWLRPVGPFGGGMFAGPVGSVAMVAVLGALVAVALGAALVLLFALAALGFVLTEVLGISIEVEPFRD